MDATPIQDQYPDLLSYCYGCGRLNPAGYQLKTTWDGSESITRFTPRPEHMAVPGYVYGGVLASIIDCACTGTAAAAVSESQSEQALNPETPRFLTASLKVDYLLPTPLGIELVVRSRVEEIKGRKVTVQAEILAGEQVTVRGEVVTVQVPDQMIDDLIRRNTQ